MWIVSIVSLSLVAAICALGLYHHAFKDNLLQCLGMAGLLIFCFGSLHAVWIWGAPDSSLVGVHASMAIYSIGTLVKVTISYGRQQGWGVIARFDEKLVARKSAAGEFDSKPHHWGSP